MIFEQTFKPYLTHFVPSVIQHYFPSLKFFPRGYCSRSSGESVIITQGICLWFSRFILTRS